MADVKVLGRDRSAETSRERAQMLIVTGVVLAVALIILALFLNSIIYAENQGSRGGDIGGSDAAAFAVAAEKTAEDLIETINEDEDITDKEGEFETSLEDWHEQSQLHSGASGVYTDLTVETTVNGDQIESAEIEVTYESAQISHETTIEVTDE